jgi:hypothetical protein
MNEIFSQLLKEAIDESLSSEEFIKEFEKNPNDYCAFKVHELKAFAEYLVIECSKFARDPQELRDHFDIK